MQLIKIKSQKEIPNDIFYNRYTGELADAVAKYQRRYGYEPEKVLITDDGLIAIPSYPANGWVESKE